MSEKSKTMTGYTEAEENCRGCMGPCGRCENDDDFEGYEEDLEEQEEFEMAQMAASCTCGAWQLTENGPIHVADCVCGE